MAMFNSESERQRKENLKRMEDKRVRFAQEMEARGFRPERMFFCSREDGSFAALARHEGKLALIDAPKFGTDGEFTLELLDAPQCDREDVFERGTGLNGAFGFGTKGARGFNLFIRNGDGLFVKLPVVFGRNSWLEAPYKKNPLLKTRRRRGDANVMWDFAPIDSQSLKKIEALLEGYYLAGANAAPARPAEAEAQAEPAPQAPQAAPIQAEADGAEAFYAALEAAIRAEDLRCDIDLSIGRLSRRERCLSVKWNSADDCAVSYFGEDGAAIFEMERLPESQAENVFLSVLRGRKKA